MVQDAKSDGDEMPVGDRDRKEVFWTVVQSSY